MKINVTLKGIIREEIVIIPGAGFVMELCIRQCLPLHVHHHTHYTQYYLTQLQNMTK